MKILVLLALYPVLSRCVTIDCNTDLNAGYNYRDLCLKPYYGGDKGVEQLVKDIETAKSNENLQKEEVIRLNEIVCCALYNSFVCAKDWLQKCRNQPYEIPKPLTMENGYQCEKTEYPDGPCGVAGIASSLLLVFSAIGLLFFHSL